MARIKIGETKISRAFQALASFRAARVPVYPKHEPYLRIRRSNQTKIPTSEAFGSQTSGIKFKAKNTQTFSFANKRSEMLKYIISSDSESKRRSAHTQLIERLTKNMNSTKEPALIERLRAAIEQLQTKIETPDA